MILTNANGVVLISNDTVVDQNKKNIVTLPAGTSKVRLNVNVYSTAAVQLVLYIDGKEIEAQDLQAYSGSDRYATFEIDTSLLKDGDYSTVRLICNRNQGHGPYQNTIYIKH